MEVKKEGQLGWQGREPQSPGLAPSLCRGKLPVLDPASFQFGELPSAFHALRPQYQQ